MKADNSVHSCPGSLVHPGKHSGLHGADGENLSAVTLLLLSGEFLEEKKDTTDRDLIISLEERTCAFGPFLSFICICSIKFLLSMSEPRSKCSEKIVSGRISS